ncbi:MAG TPA: hypothetical protein VFR67_05970 [Pilimelia sp.]|nr:hypothetical protein [Pilimelia sp.]
MSFAVSSARTELAPPYAWMGGYGASPTPVRSATGTYSPLQARAVVLWDSGTPRVVVSVDVVGLSSTVDTQVRATAAGTVADADLMLLATHTHTGPVAGGLDPYITYGLTPPDESWLVDAIVAVVDDALAATPVPVTLDYQVTSQAGSRNRAGLSYVESAVPVLVARGADGMPVAVLYSWGCHPVAAGPRTLWDGDYPGAASAVIEAAIPGSIALFVPGPAGDQDPVGTRGWPLRCRLGAQLGAAVVTAATTPGRTLSGTIQTRRDIVQLPLDVTLTPVNLAAVRAGYAAREVDAPRVDWEQRHGEVWVDRIDAGDVPTTVPASIQAWKIPGSPMLRIAMVGGELVSGYAVYERGRYGGTNGLLIGGYASPCNCYIPSNELLPPVRTTGSYEGGWNATEPGLAGGSQCPYGHVGHFRAGPGGVESVMLAALDAVLA